MEDNFIKICKNQVKIRKKFHNEANLTLMQLQHQFAQENGFRSWGELIQIKPEHTRIRQKIIEKIYKPELKALENNEIQLKRIKGEN